MRELHTYVESVLGTRVYLVGGSVRDAVLGRECKDYDFATALLPDEIERRVKAAGRQSYCVGKRFGTIGFKMPDGSAYVEVTTFRSEEYEQGNRKPVVEFGADITADLSRRDFTMNALALRSDGHLIDPHGGRDDIAARVLRAVGNPRTRFKEDPLRMLRAARFTSTLNMSCDDGVCEGATRLAHRILTTSKERQTDELTKILLSGDPKAGLDFIAETRLLNFIIPELSIQVGYDQNSRYHALSLWEHTTAVVDLAPCTPELRWAALLHDIAKPFIRTEKPGRSIYAKHDLLGGHMAADVCRRLKMSTAMTEAVAEIVTTHLLDDNPLRAADNASKVGTP